MAEERTLGYAFQLAQSARALFSAVLPVFYGITTLWMTAVAVVVLGQTWLKSEL